MAKMQRILLLSALASLVMVSADAQANTDATVNEIGRQRSFGTKQEELNRANPTRIAQGLGLDSAIARRKLNCISNDLRIECRDEPIATDERGQFYVDWNSASKRCFITTIKPVSHVVTGGGPFYTRAQARAAIRSIAGCQ